MPRTYFAANSPARTDGSHGSGTSAGVPKNRIVSPQSRSIEVPSGKMWNMHSDRPV